MLLAELAKCLCRALCCPVLAREFQAKLSLSFESSSNVLVNSAADAPGVRKNFRANRSIRRLPIVLTGDLARRAAMLVEEALVLAQSAIGIPL